MSKRYCVIRDCHRDLYFGEVTATDEEVVRTKSVRVTNCRHIAYWHGPRGGDGDG